MTKCISQIDSYFKNWIKLSWFNSLHYQFSKYILHLDWQTVNIITINFPNNLSHPPFCQSEGSEDTIETWPTMTHTCAKNAHTLFWSFFSPTAPFYRKAIGNANTRRALNNVQRCNSCLLIISASISQSKPPANADRTLSLSRSPPHFVPNPFPNRSCAPFGPSAGIGRQRMSCRCAQ